MSEELMLKCLIAFILGYFLSKHMGNGFSVGGEEIDCEKVTFRNKEYTKFIQGSSLTGADGEYKYNNNQWPGNWPHPFIANNEPVITLCDLYEKVADIQSSLSYFHERNRYPIHKHTGGAPQAFFFDDP